MADRAAQIGQADSFQSWFQSVPLITKVFLVGTLVTGAGLSFKFLDGSSLVLIWPLITDRFQIWRLITPFFFAGPFSFNFALHTLVLYENCKRYETNPFNTGAGGNTADFLWMLCITMSVLLLLSYIFGLYVLSEPILYVIMYVWSRRDPEIVLNIWGFRFKAMYLPWVYIAIRLVMGGAITEPLMGVAVGHLYFFLVEVMPRVHGVNLIKTPKFCVDVVKWATGLTPSGAPSTGTTAFVAPGATRGPSAAPPVPTTDAGMRYRGSRDNRPASYNWGTGRVLGSN